MAVSDWGDEARLRPTRTPPCQAFEQGLTPDCFGQFWVMPYRTDGRNGTSGNAESATCRFHEPWDGSNLTLTILPN